MDSGEINKYCKCKTTSSCNGSVVDEKERLIFRVKASRRRDIRMADTDAWF